MAATCVTRSAWNIIVAVLFMTSLTLVVARSSVKWDPEHMVEVKQGDTLQVTCTVSGLSGLAVVQVQKRDEEKQTSTIITNNEDVKNPFSGLSRYTVHFEVIEDIGTVSIYYRGIRGEDAGTLVCLRIPHTREEDIVRLQLKVLVPVQSVQLFSVSASGREIIVDSGVVTLTESSLMDVDAARSEVGTGGSGVACVATVDGSLTPPDVRIMMDSGDVTRMFVATEQSNILGDPESTATTSGLGIYYGERKMSYVTAMPETSWNDQMMTCVAAMDGFPDETVSAMVFVKYIPQIRCRSHEVEAELGDSVRLICQVRANPAASVEWYFGTGNETLDNSTDDDSWTVATEPMENDGAVEAMLDIAKLVPARLGVYRINARNSVGASEERLFVRRRDLSSVHQRDNSAVSGNARPDYSHSHGNHGHSALERIIDLIVIKFIRRRQENDYDLCPTRTIS